MPSPKSKTRALLTIAAGASSALLACTSSSALGDIAPAPDAGEDANGGSCPTTNGCPGFVAMSDAGLDADADADSGLDADDASEPSTDAAADVQAK